MMAAMGLGLIYFRLRFFFFLIKKNTAYINVERDKN